MFALLSLTVGWILAVLPVSGDALLWMPPFLVMFHIWFALNQPQLTGIFSAWLVGLSLDLLHGAPLGSQAFALAMVVYGFGLMRLRIRNLHWAAQSLFVGFGVGVFVQVSLWIRLVLGAELNPLIALGSSIAAMLVWPLVSGLLEKCCARFLRIKPV